MPFLVCDRLLLSLAGAGVVLGALTANRKTQTVTDAAVATDIHQTFDIQLNDGTAFALHLDAHFGNGRTDCADLLVVPLLDLGIVTDAALIEDFLSRAATYTVNVGQADLASFIFW